MNTLTLAIVVGLTTGSSRVYAEGPARLRFEFDDGHDAWEVVSGNGGRPFTDSQSIKRPNAGYVERIASSARPRDLKNVYLSTALGVSGRIEHKQKMEIESPVFMLLGDHCTFLLGGGNRKPSDVYVALRTLDGKEIYRTTHRGEFFSAEPFTWDVSAWKGARVVLCVVDEAANDFIQMDSFETRGRLDAEATQRRRAERSDKRRRAAMAQLVQHDGELREVIFATRGDSKNGHWYANYGMTCHDPTGFLYGDGGAQLCRLSLETGRVTLLLDEPEGSIRDPQVHYDGKKILFSYRPGGTRRFHLYEIDSDGGNLRRITDGGGDYDDIEPTYLPNDDIIFLSGRCRRFVNCMTSETSVLYRCGPNGEDVRQLSTNNEPDNTPWMLPDGRVAYTRWEYVERRQVTFHHLWSMNPDGTGQMVLFGNQRPGDVIIDAKPIPGSPKLITIFSPGHGRIEHGGSLVRLDARKGPDAHEYGAEVLISSNSLRDPYALSESCFLVAQADRLLVCDDQGNRSTLYQLPRPLVARGLQVHEPRPLRARPREPMTVDRAEPQVATANMMLANIYHGRSMQAVEPGTIKKLLVLELLPKPVNFSGGMDLTSAGGSFSLERILGTVPVEPDGSANFEAPAMRSLLFVALDENDVCVKRMQSFATFMPGERITCAGCHENRADTPRQIEGPMTLMASKRGPSRITPIEDVPDVFDFQRDIQPILTRHCADCHDYSAGQKGGPAAGGLILSADRGPGFLHSYFHLAMNKLIADGGNASRGDFPPYVLGSGGSRLLEFVEPSHHDVSLAPAEKKRLRLWLDSAAPYAGSYGALGTTVCGLHSGSPRQTDLALPEVQAMRQVIDRRCNDCHTGSVRHIPTSASDLHHGLGRGFDRKDWIKIWRYSSFRLYNTSRPEYSPLLQEPLSATAGGLQRCKDTKGQPVAVFTSTDDPDYQTILSGIAATKTLIDRMEPRDGALYCPNEHYVFHMQRFGILPADAPKDATIDPFEIDAKYWKSFWYKPAPRKR